MSFKIHHDPGLQALLLRLTGGLQAFMGPWGERPHLTVTVEAVETPRAPRQSHVIES